MNGLNTPVASPTEYALQIRGASKHFGGLHALSGVDLEIHTGQIYGLIGPNGAGKTTLFNVITGLYPPDGGSFALHGQSYTPSAVHRVVKRGLARTFQNIRLFGQMSAQDNIMVARHTRTHSGLLGILMRTASMRQEEEQMQESAQSWLNYVGLGQSASVCAAHLSYGDQRRLEIARALATDAPLIALDEPAAGMNGAEKVQLRELISRMRQDGRTILLIEHDVKLVMGLCDALTVLDYGKVIAQGAPFEIQKNPEVIAAYLGGGGL